MADIAMKSSNASSQTGNSSRQLDVEESIEQMTLPAEADMGEGTPVFVNSSGKFQATDASLAGTADAYGITVRKVLAGEPVTAIAKGVLGGFDFSAQAYGADIFLSDTEGKLADAAGTVSKKVGEVIPVYGQTRGNSPAKLLRVNL